MKKKRCRMKISVIRPSLLEKTYFESNSIFVVIDTFRATTTLSTLKNSGVKNFYVVENKEDAEFLKQKSLLDCLLIGEERGIKIEGFDYGNSPSSLLGEKLSSREVIFTSSNGAKTLFLLESKVHVYLAALVNLSSVAQAVSNIALENNSEIVVIPAGIFENSKIYAIEDWITAVHLVEKITKIIPYLVCIKDKFWKKTIKILGEKRSIGSLLINSDAGQYLEKIGYGEDILFAINLDRFNNFLKVKKWRNFDDLKCVELE